MNHFIWIYEVCLFNILVYGYVCLSYFRVDPETKISTLREEIEQQLGSDLVPRDYVFLKSVGRSLTRVSSHQISEVD